MVMPGSTRRRELWVGIVAVGLVLLVAGGCAVVMLINLETGSERASTNLELPDEWRSVHGVRDVTAVDESRRIPGDNFGEADRWEHSVRVEVTLADDLSGAEAAAAGRDVLRLLEPEIARLVPETPADRISTAFTVGSTECSVGASGRGPLEAVGDALADAVALREAGATTVSLSASQAQTGGPGKADVRAPKDVLAQVATVARHRQRPVDLLGDEAWYRSNELPDPVAVKLVVDVSVRPSVTTAQLSAPYSPLTVLLEAAEGDRVLDDVSRWLTAYDGYPGRSGQPLAYVVQGTHGGMVEGWVGGVRGP
ncbi:hypothetical protein ABT304_24860 [Nocardioides sp. NPDC000445]|uniref:hypothetical protein n=1 Tax=Nocardioides sp. NPDC000445 TaxID=3154257 RepID=UPI003325DE42